MTPAQFFQRYFRVRSFNDVRSLRRGAFVAGIISFLVVGLSLGGTLGCATGTVDTSAGPRPAATVQAQDAIADVLKVADDTYKQVVAIHDATPVCSATVTTSCDPADVHAARRAKLLTAARVLRASWGGLISWKQSGDPTAARLAFCDLKGELPDLEGLAVSFNLIKQADADKWIPVVASALNTAGGGCP